VKKKSNGTLLSIYFLSLIIPSHARTYYIPHSSISVSFFIRKRMMIMFIIPLTRVTIIAFLLSVVCIHCPHLEETFAGN